MDGDTVDAERLRDRMENKAALLRRRYRLSLHLILRSAKRVSKNEVATMPLASWFETARKREPPHHEACYQSFALA
ncbi:MAG: hypothetical protein BGP08_16855 [Rhizobiales bacterium 64-17]|nr:MAG: hypothetical protein BGP08_16855 [Rhizobiales bacterium 64-17]